MPFASFEQFGAQLCAAAGVPLPPLQADSAGLVGFRLTTRNVVADLAHYVSPENDDVFILVEFGTVPEKNELATMRLLAEANFELLSATAPVFGRLASGEIVLRQYASLRKIDAAGAIEMIRRLADLALTWRTNPTMAQPPDEQTPCVMHEQFV